jgi:hypothetical protein
MGGEYVLKKNNQLEEENDIQRRLQIKGHSDIKEYKK